MNPAEAFVFGAAVLVHDAGLTTVAYPSGLAGLRETAEWKDIAASVWRSDNLPPNAVKASPQDLDHEVVFAVLRELHAKCAETLVTQEWTLPNGTREVLLDDSELRSAFGESIGRIAHSHHLDLDRVAVELVRNKCGSPVLPPLWTINEQKLACLLRCADAAQVDRTRAPSLTFAASRPSGESELHWTAQNKMNRPVLKGAAIQFSSGTKFSTMQAGAWWTAYDLACVLDQELKKSNELLNEIGVEPFAAQKVTGAGSPKTFARFVETDGWRPLDASVRVSDPLRLASTLGGRHLYGPNLLVPFRELIQNAADAVRARRALEEERQPTWGTIAITLVDDPNCHDAILVHVDDTGIGMSERVLCGPLVDFGKSFWSSRLMREEFPGLQSRGMKPIGKFGIGFFSVFEMAKDVWVTSKKYGDGQDKTRTLHFPSLSGRPILLDAQKGALPVDCSTRVTLRVDASVFERAKSLEIPFPRRAEMINPDRARLGPLLRSMVSFLDMTVTFEDRALNKSFTHTPDIYVKSANAFLEDVYAADGEFAATDDPDIAQRLRTLFDPTGREVGRAALHIGSLLEAYRSRSSGGVSTGGLVGFAGNTGWRSRTAEGIPYFGVLEGETDRAARDLLKISDHQGTAEKWLDEQVKLIDLERYRTAELMKIAAFAAPIIGKTMSLPFAFHDGKRKTFADVKRLATATDEFLLPLKWEYESMVHVRGYDELAPDYFEVPLVATFLVLALTSDRLLTDEKAREANKAGSCDMLFDDFYKKWKGGTAFLDLLSEQWGRNLQVSLRKETVFKTKIPTLLSPRWILALARPAA